MFWYLVRMIINVLPAMRQNKFIQYRISFIVDEVAINFNFINKNPELLKVIIESRKDVYVIPCNAGYDSYMREKKMKLGTFFYNTCRILIPLTHYNWSISYIY